MAKKKGPVITVQDMSDALDRARLKSGSILFRPTAYATFVELDYKLVRDAFDQIATKISLVEAGVDEFSPAEKVLFELFLEHAKTSG